MKTFYSMIATLILLTATQGFGHTNDQNQRLFRTLSQHPAFDTTLFQDQALIMEYGSETYYAAFALVQSEWSPWVCAYAAPFDSLIGQEPGNYIFKPNFICDSRERLKPYTGRFPVKVPPCPREVCANPAIGVGNLRVTPLRFLDLNNLYERLPVIVKGELKSLANDE